MTQGIISLTLSVTDAWSFANTYITIHPFLTVANDIHLVSMISQFQDFLFLRLFQFFYCIGISLFADSAQQRTWGQLGHEDRKPPDETMKPLAKGPNYANTRRLCHLGITIWPPVYLGLWIWYLYGAFGIKDGLFGIRGRVLSKHLIPPDTLSFCR